MWARTSKDTVAETTISVFELPEKLQKYRADIDGLRALAIVLVTVFHFDLLGVGKAGFIGVDIFFVISGFLITSIIIHEMEQGKFHYGAFLYRRVRRLYPAMMATLVLFLIAGSFLLLPDAFRELGQESILSQLYVVNFYFWRTVNYFGLHAASVPLLHMWSLAIEEQFYLFFPLSCMLIWRWRPSWLPAVILMSALLSFLLGLYLTSVKPWAAFYLLPTRAWELLAGAALAAFLRSHVLPSGLTWALGPLGLFLVFVSVYMYNPATMVPGWYSLLPVSASLCLIVGGLNVQSPATRLLSARPMVWIGLISYPLYLVHWPILFLFRESMFSFTLPWRILGFGLSFILATLIYLWIEKPIREKRRFVNPAAFLGAVGSLNAVLVVVSLLAVWQNGLPQRFDPEVSRILAFKDDEARVHRHCEAGILRGDLCVLGDQSVSSEMLIIGDSHANAFAHSIDKWLVRTGRAGHFSFSHGCLPIRDLGPPKCTTHFEAALSYVIANPGIKRVMILSIWRQPFDNGMLHRGQWTPPGEIEQVFSDELQRSVADFRERGVSVVLVEPFFSVVNDVPRTLAKNAAFGRAWPVDQSIQQHLTDFSQLYEAFSHAEEAGAKRISLIEDLCDGRTCQATYDGRPIFTDNNHLSDAMSDVMSVIFEREMADIE